MRKNVKRLTLTKDTLMNMDRVGGGKLSPITTGVNTCTCPTMECSAGCGTGTYNPTLFNCL